MIVKSFRKFILTVFLVGFSLYTGYWAGRRGYIFQFVDRLPTISVENRTPTNQVLDFSLFWKVYDLLNQKFLNGPIEAKKLLYGAAVGLYNASGDPYTAFLPPVENKQVNASLKGEYEGIGAELGIRGNRLTVVSPLDGSPAQAVGIKAGDIILKVDGKETDGLSISDAVTKIRGPAGTKVTLTIETEIVEALNSASPSTSLKKKVEDVSIIRGSLKAGSLKWEDKGDGLAYVRISRFGDTTNLEWDKAVSEIRAKISPLRAVILDLRSNPGGYFPSAVHIASEFIESGVVSYQEFANKIRDEYNVDHLGAFTKTEGLVLINKGSASAAEIVAGALRDRRHFKLLGEKSFGKGTVQETENFPDGSGVHITIARWLTPSGYNIHDAGLEPDIKVEFSESESNNGKDSQLDKALETVKKF